MRGLLTTADLCRSRIERLLAKASKYQSGQGNRHPDAVVGLAFFEASLRTRVGFDVAAARLQARTSTVTEAKQTSSMAVPESLDDTIRSIAPWLNVLCLRHADAGAIRIAAALTDTPIVNCGNGDDEHPTQALIDLLTMQVLFGRIDGLRIALIGDLDAMRATHSLVLALASFEDVYLRCLSPPGLELPRRWAEPFCARGHRLEEYHELALDDVDVVYVAGLPAPTRIGVLTDAEQAAFRVTEAVADRLRDDARIMCALPRVDEISRGVDSRPQAAYFRQSKLGLPMRMAVLDDILSQPTG